MAEEKEKTYAFPKSVYGLLKILPRRGQERVAMSILDLYFEGFEPDGLGLNEARVFDGISGRVLAARNNSLRRAGEASEGATGATTETATGSATETGTGSATEDESTLPTEGGGEGDKENKKEEKIGAARFRAPTTEEVRAFALEAGISIDADRFCDYYASKGWMVGKSHMKDWQASVRNWARRDKQGKDAGYAKFSEYAGAF